MKKSSQKISKRKVKKSSPRRKRSPKMLKKTPKYSMNILNIDHNKIYIHVKKNNRKSDGSIKDDVKNAALLIKISSNIKNNELFKHNSSSWSSILLNYDDKDETNMKSIVKSRKQLVDELLKLLCIKSEGCSSIITGSNTLKSDIDVTLLVTKESENFTTYQHLKKILESVGILFEGNENSSELLDVNFYCHSYFFPKNIGDILTKNPKKEEFYLTLNDKYEKNYKSQLGFALLKIAMYSNELKEDLIDDKTTLDSIIAVCKEGLKNFKLISNSPLFKKDYDNLELYNYVVQKEKDEQKSQKYIEQLEYINKLITSFDSKKEDKELYQYRLLCEISHASIYAEEAYFCYGAFMDVVYNSQLEQTIKLNENCYVHSILDNFGFLLQVYSLNKKKDVRNFIIKGSKYIQRIYSAYNKIKGFRIDVFEQKEDISYLIRQNNKKDIPNKEYENKIIDDFKKIFSDNIIGILMCIYKDIVDNIIKINVTPYSSRRTSLEATPSDEKTDEVIEIRKIHAFPLLE